MKAKNLFIGLAGLCVSSAILVYGSVKEPSKGNISKDNSLPSSQPPNGRCDSRGLQRN